MPFPRRKAFKTLSFTLFLVTLLLCSLAVNMTAIGQEQAASTQNNNNNESDREKSEAQSAAGPRTAFSHARHASD